MPTLTIPLGSDPSGMRPGTATWIDTFFHTNQTDSDQAAVAGLVSASSSVTGTDPLGLPDTTSYASADGPTFHAGLPAGAPWRDTSTTSGSGKVMIGGRQTTAVTLPADAFNLAAQLVMLARNSYAEAFNAFFIGRNDAGTTLLSATHLDYLPTTAFTEFRMTLGSDRTAWATALAQRQVYAYLSPGSSYSGGIFDVAYLAVELTYDLPTPPTDTGSVFVPEVRITPDLRMLQRGGSGGIGGIPRLVGNPTRRGSLRQGPGGVY